VRRLNSGRPWEAQRAKRAFRTPKLSGFGGYRETRILVSLVSLPRLAEQAVKSAGCTLSMGPVLKRSRPRPSPIPAREGSQYPSTEHDLRTVRYVELLHDIAKMNFHRIFGDAELERNELVLPTFS
jgi:hypothetical protein